jgi:DNA-binding NarL/FixJ family response regulator
VPAFQESAGVTVRVVLADDQRIVREGLALVLGLLPGVELVGTAVDGQEAVELCARLRPDVVLMDLRMPRVDGVQATARIRAEHPSVEVIVLTTYADDESIFTALRAGARGYLTKDARAEEIGAAITRVAAGEAMLDPAVQARLLEHLGSMTPTPDALPTEARSARPLEGLTARETEVLALIAAGLSNQEIAQRLVVSEATVKTHVNRLFAKTGVRDRAQAVALAYRAGLVQP